jgi:hypothetical protein
VISKAQQTHAFGDKMIVCDECGIPKPPEKFAVDSVVCKGACADRVMLRRKLSLTTPQDQFLSKYEQHLKELRNTRHNHTIDSADKAIGILGETPAEKAAHCVNQLMNPVGDEDLSEEQIAAMPKDYKTIGHFLKLINDTVVNADKQLADVGNPFADMTHKDLRGIVMKTVTEEAKSDQSLRLDMIRTLMQTCSTFLEEVTLVAKEMEAIEI